EEVLGEALEGGLRAKVKIGTKQPLGAMHTNADIRRNLESTLRKLRTDYIDVYLIHNINASDWEEVRRREIFHEYEKLRDEGLIKAIAFSYHGDCEPLAEVMAAYPWDMFQVQQNFLDVGKLAPSNAFALAEQTGAALVVMEPLRGGGLAAAPASVQAIYDAYPTQHSPVEWAFRYVANQPSVSTILSGMSTMEQLKEDIAIFSKPDVVPGCLTDADRAMLRKVKAAYDSVTAIPCTACEYCMPCPFGVDIPGVFEQYNNAVRFEFLDLSKRGYNFLVSSGHDVSKCQECHECEGKCPQAIAIVDELKRSQKTLAGWIE
ncbi:MAG: aldo/keto reductase, partial [Eggerthellaceae bacterium]|nr:aldo/keto reductase [Eggerthellaceae bacterium]